MSQQAHKYHEAETKSEGEKRRRGRPRSQTSKKSVLDATNRLLLHSSVQDLSIEGIAKKAGVGKTTIYRWWPNKVAIVLDALVSQMGNITPLPTTASKAEAVEKQLERFIRLLKGKNGKIVIEAMAEAQSDEESLTVFYERFMLQHEKILADLIEAGKLSGEFRKDLDTSLAVDMIYGSIVYRLMSGAETLDDTFTKNMPVEALFILKA
ncbi:MAG: TetR family transcriptional regulator [Micavibrio sp.]|nr:TetR family transcriptional regulator [Micavibrio sp.]|tara:strand:+ start:640114 stop:640740 length:627 start_codon:yes stop_codon:yes gene_type:complete